jgi:23S rRNA (uracil1939-C5)-methyltransferase
VSRRPRKKRLPEPVAQVSVESLAHDGRGVTHLDGKAVFIEGALPGEVVSFEYLSSRKKFDEGRVLEVHQASVDRVEPKCPHFGLCGGCSLQHMDAKAQILAKQQVLLDNLGRLGKVTPEEVLVPLTGPVWGYRSKARLGARYVIKKGRLLVGFRERHKPYVADLSRCEVLHPSVGERIRELAALIGALEAKAGIPQVEVSVSEGVTALVFRHLEPLCAPDLEAFRQFAVEQDIHVYLQPGGPGSIHLLWPEQSSLSYHLSEQAVEIRFRPTDFTQVNMAINQQMVTRVLEMLALQPQDSVLDLFCGLGNFTLPMARLAGTVTGVEGDAGLVSRARDNAVLNRIENAHFYTADLAADGADAAWAGGSYDKVLLDPPRCGAAGMMNTLGNIQARQIVYVSCHPGSLARDAGILVNELGYRLRSAGVMDMFPHTAHVESIALFEMD